MKTLRFLLPAALAFFLFSCDNVTEEIYLDEDGSGRYELYSDVIPGMVKMSTEMARLGRKMDTTGEKPGKSEIEKTAREKVWKDFPDEIDSVYDITKGVPDSIINYGDNKEYLQKVEGFMHGGRSKGYVYNGMRYSFEDMKELNSFLDFANEAQSAKSAARTGRMKGGMNTSSEASYALVNNTFSRKVEIKNPQDLDDPEDPSVQFMVMMMGESEYTTIVHTPRKVKLVNGGGRITGDKEVTFTYRLMDLLSGKGDFDFEIIMEK